MEKMKYNKLNTIFWGNLNFIVFKTLKQLCTLHLSDRSCLMHTEEAASYDDHPDF